MTTSSNGITRKLLINKYLYNTYSKIKRDLKIMAKTTIIVWSDSLKRTACSCFDGDMECSGLSNQPDLCCSGTAPAKTCSFNACLVFSVAFGYCAHFSRQAVYDPTKTAVNSFREQIKSPQIIIYKLLPQNDNMIRLHCLTLFVKQQKISNFHNMKKQSSKGEII